MRGERGTKSQGGRMKKERKGERERESESEEEIGVCCGPQQ